MRIKNLINFMICILLTLLAIIFIQYRDNEIAKNYDRQEIIESRGIVVKKIEENNKQFDIVEVGEYSRYMVPIKENENLHKDGDKVILYTVGPNFDCYHYSKIEAIKHETNMVRYYPLVIIPAIGIVVNGFRLRNQNK